VTNAEKLKRHADRLDQRPNNGTSTANPMEFAPNLVCMADVVPVSVSWLWPERIAIGRITLLVGRPGTGKSYFTAWLAAALSTGRRFPDGCFDTLGDTILMSAEDNPSDIIRPRLDACEADCSRVHVLESAKANDANGKIVERLVTLSDLPIIEAAIAHRKETRLLVVDPIGSYLGRDADAHRDNEVRSVLAPLADLAKRFKVAVVLVAHTRKAAGDSADDLVLGSRAFTGLARTVWHLFRDNKDKNRHLLLPGKNNLGPPRDGLAFRLEGEPLPAVQWEDGSVQMSADDALAAESRSAAEKRVPGPAADKKLAAGRWLAEALAAGPQTLVDLRERSEQAGHRWRTVQDAANDLDVDKYRSGFGGGALWRLPSIGKEPCANGVEVPQGENNSASLHEQEKQGKNADSELCTNGAESIGAEFPHPCTNGEGTPRGPAKTVRRFLPSNRTKGGGE
jgi:putative DNA primase/helicase